MPPVAATVWMQLRRDVSAVLLGNILTWTLSLVLLVVKYFKSQVGLIIHSSVADSTSIVDCQLSTLTPLQQDLSSSVQLDSHTIVSSNPFMSYFTKDFLFSLTLKFKYWPKLGPTIFSTMRQDGFLLHRTLHSLCMVTLQLVRELTTPMWGLFNQLTSTQHHG
jgi:hypothetical protein